MNKLGLKAVDVRKQILEKQMEEKHISDSIELVKAKLNKVVYGRKNIYSEVIKI